MRRFLDRSLPAFSRCTAHLYISGLAWLPASSTLGELWKAEFGRLGSLSPSNTFGVSVVHRMTCAGLVYSVAVSKSSKTLAVGLDNGEIELWDIQNGTFLKEMKQGQPVAAIPELDERFRLH